MTNNNLLSYWVEMIQEDETLTLLYFNSYAGFQKAMEVTNNVAYLDFWTWKKNPDDDPLVILAEYEENSFGNSEPYFEHNGKTIFINE